MTEKKIKLLDRNLNDSNISLKAKGIFSYMLSLDDLSKFSIINVSKVCRDGTGAIASVIRELENNGYIKRYRTRENGSYTGFKYEIQEAK